VAREVAGSFPFPEWASEVSNALQGAGVDAEVSYAGPRAYPVLIDEEDSEKAQEILSQIGYLTCAAGSPSLSGILDWIPEGAFDEDELRDEIQKTLEETIESMAHAHAAEAWSTPYDDLKEKYKNPWTIAYFGEWIAINGDLVSLAALRRPPRDYELVHEGGRVPTTEEHVSLEHAIEAVAKNPELAKYPKEIVRRLLDEIVAKEYKNAQEIPVSVSGEVEIWARVEEDDDGE
jgi:hypothetical protein